ncbi:hypothetical protein C8R47DRAFT_1082292 [Mycena vitilis]|nr:hypothetical protein C8R47DRAFT_1082292 [Mycena vitilis]
MQQLDLDDIYIDMQQLDLDDIYIDMYMPHRPSTFPEYRMLKLPRSHACPQTANTSWLAVIYEKLKKLFNGKADLPEEFEMDVLDSTSTLNGGQQGVIEMLYRHGPSLSNDNFVRVILP